MVDRAYNAKLLTNEQTKTCSQSQHPFEHVAGGLRRRQSVLAAGWNTGYLTTVTGWGLSDDNPSSFPNRNSSVTGCASPLLGHSFPPSFLSTIGPSSASGRVAPPVMTREPG